MDVELGLLPSGNNMLRDILELQKMKYMSSLGYFVARNCAGCLVVLLWAIPLERVERQKACT
jgi:hypothetical protein